MDPETVITKGRLQPGKMFLIDFEKGKMIPDEEIKERANRILLANVDRGWATDSNPVDKMKYVIVTGGVLSGLGKGVTASSIGVLLREKSVKVNALNGSCNDVNSR